MSNTNIFVKIGLSLAIAVVLPLTVGLGIEAFYPSLAQPYEKCREFEARGPDQDFDSKKLDDCFKEHEQPVKTYDRNVFIITMILGFGAIASGAIYFGQKLSQIVSPGLVFGGLFITLYGSGRAFNAVDKRVLFVELILILIGLIFVTHRFLGKENKEDNA